MKKRTYVIAAIAAALVIAALLLKFFYTDRRPEAITLPSPTSQSEPNSSADTSGQIDITTDTVCAVLSKLSRTDCYSRSFTVTTYWDGGESTDTLSVWEKENALRMTLEHAGSQKNLLINGRDMYVWYDNISGGSKSTYYKDFDYKDADRFTRLLTYEELLDMPPEAITDAGYSQNSGEPCIYVEYTGDNDYVNQLYISVNSGLLVSAQIFDGEELIYSMQSTTTELSTPSDEMFAPPESLI